MSSSFAITSKVNLVVSNLNQVSGQIRNKLENVTVRVNSSLDRAFSRDLNEINRSLRDTRVGADQARDSMKDFGRQTAITIKRFGAYTLVTAGFFRFISSVNRGIKEAIDFQDQLVRIRQVTGESLLSLRSLNNEVDRLSTTLGVSSKELLTAAQVLAQAGLNAKEVRVSLQALAKSDLAPTFDNINKTAEASIAILRQFGLTAGDLEQKLSSINAVSAKFAVESADITAAIQTTGGAFAAAGGNIEELIALFTSVRATTRESAASIATGFRTIFTRIQRSRTQDFLSGLGIELKAFGDEARKQGREGLFVGPFEAVRRLSVALQGLNSADPRFAQIIEELGGFRQISKVIPLIQQFATAQNALGVAQRGVNSLTEDAEKRQESLAIQIAKVREEFQLLLRQFGNSDAFKGISTVLIDISKSMIQVAKSIEPLITLLPILFAPSLAASTKSFLSGFTTNRVPAFAKGGMIAGMGNKDSELIAAMPGEFVIKKSSVKKYGPEFLSALNEGKIGKYAKGGLISASALGAAAVGGQTLLSQSGFDLGNIPAIGSFVIQLGVMVTVLKAASGQIEKLEDSIRESTVRIEERKPSLQDNKDNFAQVSLQRSEAIKAVRQNVNAFSENQKKIRFERQGLSGLQNKESNISDVIREEKRKLELQKDRGRSVIDNINFIKSKNIGPDGDKFVEDETKRLRNIIEDVKKSKSGIEALKLERDRVRGDIDTKQSRVEPLIEDKKKIVAELNASRAILKEKVAEKEAIRNKIKEDEAFIKLQTDKQNAENRQIRNTNILNASVAAASTGLLFFSSYLDNVAQKELNSLREGGAFDETRARRSFVDSRAQTSAVTGGIGALATAKAFAPALGAGPLGLAAAAGAVAFALFSASKATEEFETQVKLINLESLGSDLSSLLSSVQKGTSVFDVSRGINSSTRNLSSSLSTETDQAIRDSLKALIGSNTTALTDFINKAVSVSSSLQDLDRIVSSTTQQLVADQLNQTLSTFRKGLQESIKFQNDNNQALEKAVRVNRQFEIGILSQRALDSAAKNAADSLQFLSSGASEVFAGAGLNLNPRTTSTFSQISTGVADNNTSTFLSSFAKNFGDAAKRLSDESIAAAEAIKILPNVLLEIRSSDALGGTGNFLTRLGQSLEDAGIGPAITEAIVAKATDIIGPEGKDSAILERLNKDFLNTLDEFTKNLTERNQAIFTELESATIANLKQFSDGLTNASKALENIQERAVRRVDNQRVLQDVISSVTGRSDFRAERQLDQNRTNIITGGRNSDQLLQDLRSAISGEGQLRDDLGKTQDLEQQKRLVSSINLQQNAASKASKALEELASVTSRTSTAQKQLADATKDRLTRRDLALQTITASPRELAEQNRTVELSRFAISQSLQGGDIRNVIKPDDLKNIVAFLQSLGGTKIGGLGGLSGNDGLDAILKAQLKGAGIPLEGIATPDKEEIKLVNEIRTIISDANKIETELANLEFSRRNEFINSLDTNFNKFITDLKTQISRVFENEANTRTAAIQGDINTKRGQLGVADNIRGITGIDPQTVLSNFKQINDLVNRTTQATKDRGNISSLLNDSGAFSKAISDTFAKEGKAGGGEALLKNLFSQIKDKDTLQVLNKELREGGFRETIASLTTELSKTRVQDRPDLALSLQKQLSDPLNKLTKDLDKELLGLGLDRKAISLSVGGDQNLSAVESNIKTLAPLIAKFPEGTQIQTLSDEVNKLTLELKQINAGRLPSPIPRNSGGMIPGYGTKDTVPAMLTKGEYVVKAPSVRKYGKGLMDQINSGNFQGFNEGGFVNRIKSGLKSNSNRFPKDEGFTKNNYLYKTLQNIYSQLQPSDLDLAPYLGIDKGFSILGSAGIGGESPEMYQIALDSKLDIMRNLAEQKVLDAEIKYKENLLKRGLPYRPRTQYTGMEENRGIEIRGAARSVTDRMAFFGNAYQEEIARVSQPGVAGDRNTNTNYFSSIEFKNIKDDFDKIIKLRQVPEPDYTKLLKTVQFSKSRIQNSSIKNESSVQNFLQKLNIAEDLYLSRVKEIDSFRNSFKEITKMRQVKNPDYKSLLNKVRSTKADIEFSSLKEDPRVQKFLTQLNTAESLYSQRTGFNRGGFVGGIGNGDSVNAKLTPGEYVMNKGAVQKYGANFFSSLNSQKFANGGQVQPNVNTDFMNNFNSAISRLSSIADRLSQSFANIPSEITMRATHRVEVIHNGAQVFAQIEPGLVKLVEKQTNKAINNMIMQKFPEVGVMN